MTFSCSFSRINNCFCSLVCLFSNFVYAMHAYRFVMNFVVVVLDYVIMKMLKRILNFICLTVSRQGEHLALAREWIRPICWLIFGALQLIQFETDLLFAFQMQTWHQMRTHDSHVFNVRFAQLACDRTCHWDGPVRKQNNNNNKI